MVDTWMMYISGCGCCRQHQEVSAQFNRLVTQILYLSTTHTLYTWRPTMEALWGAHGAILTSLNLKILTKHWSDSMQHSVYTPYQVILTETNRWLALVIQIFSLWHGILGYNKYFQTYLALETLLSKFTLNTEDTDFTVARGVKDGSGRAITMWRFTCLKDFPMFLVIEVQTFVVSCICWHWIIVW